MTLLQGMLDLRGKTDLRQYLLTCDQAEGVRDIAVQGVGHDHGQEVVVLGQDQGFAVLQELVGDLLGRGQLFREIFCIDQRQCQLGCQRLSHVAFGNVTQLDKDSANRFPEVLPALQT